MKMTDGEPGELGRMLRNKIPKFGFYNDFIDVLE
jgi:hypothetical protein